MKFTILSLLVFWANFVDLAHSSPAAANETRLRISNDGEVAIIEQVPYQAALIINKRLVCGGALISKIHVLTAAHCIEYALKRDILNTLVVGVGSVEWRKSQMYRVQRVSYHRDYIQKRNELGHTIVLKNDIALITLASPLQLSRTVRLIGLPLPGAELSPGELVKVTGWGSSRTSRATSSHLKVLYTRTQSTCDENYICTVRMDGHGACPGDSGSPLIDREIGVLYGIVSSGGVKCARGEREKHTKVSHYIEYIQSEQSRRGEEGSEHPTWVF